MGNLEWDGESGLWERPEYREDRSGGLEGWVVDIRSKEMAKKWKVWTRWLEVVDLRMEKGVEYWGSERAVGVVRYRWWPRRVQNAWTSCILAPISTNTLETITGPLEDVAAALEVLVAYLEGLALDFKALVVGLGGHALVFKALVAGLGGLVAVEEPLVTTSKGLAAALEALVTTLGRLVAVVEAIVADFDGLVAIMELFATTFKVLVVAPNFLFHLPIHDS
ncbi:hypothetical protein ACH5RR_001333 [Cinchona calisaya]|uniref:Uncharacterized protein n=1 Tax=Cinchona calisaya TaxID=153742 RepID=A0ABD3B337_9GENT